MSKNYLTYPCKTMRITQSYDGKTSHIKHLNGKPKDYSIDEGGKDGGRDSLYCPCDEMVLSKMRGVGADGTNTIWLTSLKPVVCPNGYEGTVTLQAIHPNDDDLKKLNVGQKFKRGEFICREGSDGATGNHFHFAVGKGKFTGTGWVKNNLGAWVLTTTGGAMKPENAFYIDPKFTTIKDAKGLKFKQLPKKTTAKKTSTTKKKSSFLPSRGYFKKGDISPNVGKVATFMRKTFPSYTNAKVLGNTYGDNLIAAITEFQKRTGLKADGCIGAKTLAELKKYGFEE